MMNAMDLDPQPDIFTHWCTDLYNLPTPFLYTIPTATATSLSSSSSSSSSSSPPSTSGGAADDMASSIRSVEEILSYRFKDKSLLEEALTHSSYNNGESFKSYQRLEFVGDAVLGLALSNYVFLAYPNLEPGQLSSLRAANISTEKLARVAVRHGLHRFIRHNAAPLHDKFLIFLEKDEGPPHDKKYVSSVQIPTLDGVLYIEGDEKSRVKEAQNSAASWIIRALQESNYL
ncbi:hypothetical protein SO802_014546 [Lithocarpus litseifolius]|uniref:RNase III domain-containing protein n=1 Tax=Lithocarpus litseifolius TaxID=425828 RepID=A0AAW2CR87_9ROSI